jgi:hypothetical protein
MRRSFIAATSLLLLAAFAPAAASAAPPTRFTDHAVVVDCFLTNDDGTVGAFAVDSSEFGAFGELTFWAAPATPGNADPTLVSIGADVSATDTSLSADYELVALPSEDPGGTAELRVTLTPTGPAEPVSDRFREGNRWNRIEGTIQPVAVEGTLDVPGAATFDAAGCFGAIQDLTFYATNPASFVERFDNFSLSCFWETADGEVALFASADMFFAFGDVSVSDATGEYAGFADVTMTTTAFDGTWDLFLQPDGETAVGSASASATLASTGETIRTKDASPPNFARFISQPFSVDGELEVTTPGGTQTLPMDGEHCFAAQEHAFFHSVRPAGPKPGPLANDAPEDAAPARLGRMIRIVTGGNALAPEEPCTVVDPETNQEFELPFGYTAWWTFVGTGGAVTIDTAGSTFDTILAVYTGSPGSFTQVACVDDVFEPDFSLQSRVTIDTLAGVTYYVQAGGFGGDSGRLQLVIRSGS